MIVILANKNKIAKRWKLFNISYQYKNLAYSHIVICTNRNFICKILFIYIQAFIFLITLFVCWKCVSLFQQPKVFLTLNNKKITLQFLIFKKIVSRDEYFFEGL